jgi:hypothetical protein
MPVEIRELIIRAVVEDDQNHHQPVDVEKHLQQNQQAIVAECVKQVLKILKRKQER